MTTTSLTLTAFLLARIAEDEAIYGLKVADVKDVGLGGPKSRWGFVAPSSDYSPRMLAECEAKRALVNLHAPSDSHPTFSSTRGTTPTCVACVYLHADMDCENEHWPCPTLRTLAAVHADHPDYDEAWCP